MPLKIAVFKHEKTRSRTVCNAMYEGIKSCGESVSIRDSEHWRSGSLDVDVAIFYGLGGNLMQLFREYSASENHHAVYIDLGYWGRRDNGRFMGYHKLSVDNRHPTRYFQRKKHDDSRIRKFGVETLPYSKFGGAFLVAGMSEKAALVEGFQAEQWEKMAIAEIRKRSDRPIIYRPKPSWKGAKALPGADFSNDPNSLYSDLSKSYMVVTHHSNVGVDGLIAGIPVLTIEGVASPMSINEFSKINSPIYPSGREQWLADIAWTQWSVDEMASGDAWRYLRNEELF